MLLRWEVACVSDSPLELLIDDKAIWLFEFVTRKCNYRVNRAGALRVKGAGEILAREVNTTKVELSQLVMRTSASVTPPNTWKLLVKTCNSVMVGSR